MSACGTVTRSVKIDIAPRRQRSKVSERAPEAAALVYG